MRARLSLVRPRDERAGGPTGGSDRGGPTVDREAP